MEPSECHTSGVYSEASKLQEMAETFYRLEMHYPNRNLEGKIYCSRENIRFYKEHWIYLSCPTLGRPKQDEIRNRSMDYRDECESVEEERRFSLAKHKCGKVLIIAKQD